MQMKGTNEKWTKSQNKFPIKSCPKCGLSPFFHWTLHLQWHYKMWTQSTFPLVPSNTKRRVTRNFTLIHSECVQLTLFTVWKLQSFNSLCLDFIVNRFFMKLCNTNNMAIVSCRTNFCMNWRYLQLNNAVRNVLLNARHVTVYSVSLCKFYL